MRIVLYALERLAWRSLGLFVLIEGLVVFASVLELSAREPILGLWGLRHLAPSIASYTAGTCLLAALTAATASSFAGLGHTGELTAANAVGIGPGRWLAPAIGLALAVTPYSLYHESEVFPRARAAKKAAGRMLFRSPEVSLRVLAVDLAYLPDVALSLRPGKDGRFDRLWAVRTGEDGLPASVWHAAHGRVLVPQARDVVRLELTDAHLWQRGTGGAPERVDADTMQIDVPVRALSRRSASSERSRVRDMTLGELRAFARQAGDSSSRNLARAEWAARLALGLAPLPLVLAAVAAGLGCVRRGAALGMFAGFGVFGLLFLPLHTVCVRLVVDGFTPWLVALPSLVLVISAARPIARWRTG